MQHLRQNVHLVFVQQGNGVDSVHRDVLNYAVKLAILQVVELFLDPVVIRRHIRKSSYLALDGVTSVVPVPFRKLQ